MRIDVRNSETGRRVGRVEIDPVRHPTRARTVGTDHEVFLDWEQALDDAGMLRRCVVCGCRELYSARVFPQITGIVVVLAFAGAAIGLSGVANRFPVLYIVLVAVLLLDIASLVFARRRLVCYHCRSTYSNLEIARHHGGWDRAVAEKHRGRRGRPTEPGIPEHAQPSPAGGADPDAFD